jgi:hypothetical protein
VSRAFCVVLLLCVGCSTARPIVREATHVAIADPWIEARHLMGFEVAPSLLMRLLTGSKLPQSNWRLRIATDGRVEREVSNRCGTRIDWLRSLDPAKRGVLEKLVVALGEDSVVIGGPGEDVRLDEIVVRGDDGNVWTVSYWHNLDPAAHSRKAVFDRTWAQITAWYEPPVVPHSRCESAD